MDPIHRKLAMLTKRRTDRAIIMKIGRRSKILILVGWLSTSLIFMIWGFARNSAARWEPISIGTNAKMERGGRNIVIVSVSKRGVVFTCKSCGCYWCCEAEKYEKPQFRGHLVFFFFPMLPDQWRYQLLCISIDAWEGREKKDKGRRRGFPFYWWEKGGEGGCWRIWKRPVACNWKLSV